MLSHFVSFLPSFKTLTYLFIVIQSILWTLLGLEYLNSNLLNEIVTGIAVSLLTFMGTVAIIHNSNQKEIKRRALAHEEQKIVAIPHIMKLVNHVEAMIAYQFTASDKHLERVVEYSYESLSKIAKLLDGLSEELQETVREVANELQQNWWTHTEYKLKPDLTLERLAKNSTHHNQTIGAALYDNKFMLETTFSRVGNLMRLSRTNTKLENLLRYCQNDKRSVSSNLHLLFWMDYENYHYDQGAIITDMPKQEIDVIDDILQQSPDFIPKGQNYKIFRFNTCPSNQQKGQ